MLPQKQCSVGLKIPETHAHREKDRQTSVKSDQESLTEEEKPRIRAARVKTPILPNSLHHQTRKKGLGK